MILSLPSASDFGSCGSSKRMDDKIKNEVDDEQESWSELPTDLIWMVKNRLNRVDNARVGFICENWSLASLNYPPKTQDNCVDVPWLMNHRDFSNECEFINISTMEKLVLELPEFHSSNNFYLFSKCGWLLFRRLSETKYNNDSCLILFNPFTSSSSIIWSEPRDSTKSIYASFSVFGNKEGAPQPQHVVLLERDGINTLILQIYKVGDNTWTSHSYVYEREVHAIGSVVIHEHKVYHTDEVGEMLMFDIDSHVWTRIIKNAWMRKPLAFNRWWMMEFEGEIVKIDRGVSMNTCRFYKLNDNETGWEELNDDKDRSWFLHANRRNNQFAVKEIRAKNKIYRIEQWQEKIGSPCRDVIKVYNKSGSLMPSSCELQPGTVWVDLGTMHKLPSSCKVYESI